MPLFYALVARGTVVLSEHSINTSSNYASHTTRLLKQINQSNNQSHSQSQSFDQLDEHVEDQRSFRHPDNDQLVYHIDQSNEMIFLCLSDVRFSKHLAYNFLHTVRQRMAVMFGARVNTAIAYQFQRDFEKVLDSEMKLINQSTSQSNDPDSKITEIRAHVADVKDNMVANLDRVVERGDQISLLVAKTDDLDVVATRFDRHGRVARKTMCRKHAKWAIIAVLLIAAIIVVILLSVCGTKFDKCG